MNKKELIREIAHRLSLSQKNVKILLEAALEEIILLMEEENGYNHTGFGTFKTELRQERIGFDPSRKKKILLPKKKKVLFRPSSRLKGKVNE